MADIDYNALGQSIDTTWGRSSTPKTSSYSVKLSMLGTDRLLASYGVLVNFGTERQMIEMKRMYEEEANSVLAATMKAIKTNYKELCGESFTAKELSRSDNLEIVGLNVHNARRQAYYRCRKVYELG